MTPPQTCNVRLIPLLENKSLNSEIVLHTYFDPFIASSAMAGQFVEIRTAGGIEPLLRRPISICSVNAIDQTFTLLIKKVGEGTRRLAAFTYETKVDMVGPLGEAFDLDALHSDSKVLLVAGGVGVAPMLFLANRIRERDQELSTSTQIIFCYGARSADEFVLLDAIRSTADRVVLTTNDGSMGDKGFITSKAETFFGSDVAIFTCGPNPMMNDLLMRMRHYGLEGQVSLENMMGCGVGACQGCVIRTRHGYRRVCCEGPVMPTTLFDSIGIQS